MGSSQVYRTVLEGGLENVAAARARSSSSGPPGARLSTYLSSSSSGSSAAEHKRSTSTARDAVKHSAGVLPSRWSYKAITRI